VQNGGFSAKFNGRFSIEHLYKTEHLCFGFRHYRQAAARYTIEMKLSLTTKTIGIMVLIAYYISFPFFKIKYFETLTPLKLI